MTLGEFLIEIGIRKNELSTIKSVMSPKNIKLLDYELVKPNDEIASDIESVEVDNNRKEIVLT